MKKSILILIAIFFLPVFTKGAAITRVQDKASNACVHSPDACVTGLFASNTTAGNTILVCGHAANLAGATNSLASVTGQGTFTLIPGAHIDSGAAGTYTNLSTGCAYAINIAGGVKTEISCNWTSPISVGVCAAYELTPGVSSVLTNTALAVSGSAVSAGVVTPTVNGAFIVVIMATADGVRVSYYGTPGAGWTQRYDGGGSAVDLVGTEDQEQAVAAAVTGDSTAVVSGSWIAAIVALQPAGNVGVLRHNQGML